MLVKNRLAYAGAVSDVIHPSDVVTLGHEYFAGGDEELSSTFLTGQPRGGAFPGYRHAHILTRA
jgi:hypothetical protein